MDKTELQQKIAEYFSKLPKDAQDIFSSMAWVDSVTGVAAKYALTDKQKEDLTTETSMALLGIIHLDQYEEGLIKEVGLSKETAGLIISELDKSIFSSIRPSLSNTFAENIGKIAQDKYGDAGKLDERFSNLPREVKDAIVDSQYQKNLYTISGKYKLKMDEMSTLDEITTKVMLGIISSENYGTELAQRINIPKDQLDNMVSEVNELVFKKIRSFLIHKKEIEDAIIENDQENIVPAPPYSRVTASAPSNLPVMENLVENEKTMESSGIEILQDKGADKPQEDKMTMREDSLMVKSGISVMEDAVPQKESHMIPNNETQKSVLYGIENPPSARNIMEMKMKGSVTQNTNTSVHSISSSPMNDPAGQNKIVSDPYHEQI